MAAMTRHRLNTRLVVAALLAVCLSLGACGSSGDDVGGGGAAEAWPMRVDLPGLLGYGSVDLRPGELQRLFVEFVGLEVRGLADTGRLVMLQLDETTHGGTQSFAVPITSSDEVTASLDAPGSGFERLDAQRVRITVDAESELGALISMARAGLGGGRPSPFAMMGALFGNSGPITLTVHAEVTSNHLILAPAFEGVSVTRSLLDRAPGLTEASNGTDSLVMVWDVERIGRAYHDQIQAARTELRNLVSAAPAAGFGAMMMQMQRGGQDAGPLGDIPRISSDILDAFLKMFDAIDVSALRIEALRGPVNLADVANDGFDDMNDLIVSPLRVKAEVPDEGTMLAAMRPAPYVPEAHWTLGADGDAWASAAAAWCAPLAIVKHGKGTIADQAVADLAEILSGWDGAMTARVGDDDAYAIFTTDPDTGFDVEALVAWFEPIVDRIGSADKPTLQSVGDDRWQLVTTDGTVAATLGTSGTAALWIVAGEANSMPLDASDAILRAPRPADGPFQRFADAWDDGDLALEFFRSPGSFELEAAWTR